MSMHQNISVRMVHPDLTLVNSLGAIFQGGVGEIIRRFMSVRTCGGRAKIKGMCGILKFGAMVKIIALFSIAHLVRRRSKQY